MTAESWSLAKFMTDAMAQSPSGRRGAEEWSDSASTDSSTSCWRCHSAEAYSSMPGCVCEGVCVCEGMCGSVCVCEGVCVRVCV